RVLFRSQVRQARIVAKIGENGVDAFLGTGDRPVDSLAGKQQRSLDMIALAKRLQRLFERFKIREIDKLVKGGNGMRHRTEFGGLNGKSFILAVPPAAEQPCV